MDETLGERDQPVADSLELRLIRSEDSALESVFALGDGEKKWIGILPYEAQRRLAREGGLVGAFRSESDKAETLVGYALFGPTGSSVRLWHLVTRRGERSGGVATALVNKVSELNAERNGILVKCLNNSPGHTFWPRAGFLAQGEMPGRGKDGDLLTYWWRDHGHPTLLTWTNLEEDQVPVLLDANTFFDLHDPDEGSQDAEITQEVFKSLEGRIEPIASPAIGNEILKNQSRERRERRHRDLGTYPKISAAPDSVQAISDHLVASIGSKKNLGDQDRLDIQHVAIAATANIDILVTRDHSAKKWLGPDALDLAGVSLVSPSELPAFLDERENGLAYRPVFLSGSQVVVHSPTWDESESVASRFLAYGSGEKRHQFRRKWESLSLTPDRSFRKTIRNQSEQDLALYAGACDDGVLEVNLARLRSLALKPTLAAAIIGQLRYEAERLGATAIRISDPHLDRAIVDAAQADRFRLIEGSWVCLTVPGPRTNQEILDIIESHRGLVKASFQDIETLLSNPNSESRSEELAACELALRPVVLKEAEIPCFQVPIKHLWAAELLGTPELLTRRSAELALGGEQVYYRAPNERENGPARILWYQSDGGSNGGSCATATSLLLDARTMPPEKAWRDFHRLGVYSRADVFDASTNGRVRVLRFTNTRQLNRVVPVARLTEFSGLHNEKKLTLMTSEAVSQAYFLAVLSEADQDA